MLHFGHPAAGRANQLPGCPTGKPPNLTRGTGSARRYRDRAAVKDNPANIMFAGLSAWISNSGTIYRRTMSAPKDLR
jgi:hypothetical protein